MTALEVWLYGRLTGRLEQERGVLTFCYDPAWIDADGPPLSHALPLRAEPFADIEARAFFANLLPEGEVRSLLAREVGVSADNDFALLDAVGGDCAGAVTLLPPGASGRDDEPGAVRWLDDVKLSETIERLPRRPLLADASEGIRLSLAGAQDKLPVVVREGRIGVPLGHTPSTHILKAPVARFEDTVANESYCLALARALGMRAATAQARHAEGRTYLLVERYDREAENGAVIRIHQEDFCQGLGLPPARKYESEGGPSLADCFGLVRGAATAPAREVLSLVDAVTLNFLIGNNDAHGKNFSLLYAGGETRLAPLYDLVSTAAYPELSRKMAMKLGGEYRPAYVRRRHVERFAVQAGLGPAAVRRRMRRWAVTAPDVAADLAQRSRESGELLPVVAGVAETVAARGRLLEGELAA